MCVFCSAFNRTLSGLGVPVSVSEPKMSEKTFGRADRNTSASGTVLNGLVTKPAPLLFCNPSPAEFVPAFHLSLSTLLN